MSPRRSVSFAAISVVLYSLLALAATWPLALQLADTLPLGTDRTDTVPLSSAWALWWNADRLQAGLEGYWDAPIFFPAPLAFAFSEAMPLLGFAAAPITWLAGPAVAHNVVLLLSLVLNGVSGLVLARRIGASRPAALAGGACVVMLPYVHHELGVLALVPIFGPLLCVNSGLRLIERPTPPRALELGLSFALAYLVCSQSAVYVVLAAAVPTLVLLGSAYEWSRLRRVVGMWSLAVTIGLAVSSPMLAAQLRASTQNHFTRSAERIQKGSATWAVWHKAPGVRVVPQPGIRVAKPEGQRALFPGWLKLLLAALALASTRQYVRRREVWFVAAVALAAFAWSWAPRIGVLADAFAHVPGLAQIRSFWRVGGIAQACVAVLVGCGLDGLWRGTARMPRVWRTSFVAGVAMLAVIELWPRRQLFADVPRQADHARLLAWIDAHVPQDAPLLHLPVPEGSDVYAFSSIARHMYVGTWHGRPLVRGYSSYFPAEYRKITATMRGFPSSEGTELLRTHGIRTLIVERTWAERVRLNGTSGWVRVFSDETLDVAVYVPRDEIL